MAEENVIIDRDYVDNFSVKEYCENTLIPKYFPDIDVSLRTVGMVGYVTELITNYGEDTFNTGSVLFRETFPNRAQVQESIYSHAALFQLDYLFARPSACKFLLVLEESAIIENMVNYYDKDTGIYHFYIDKDTIIYIEDTPYTLDYDIQMDIIKKSNSLTDEYVFSAKYLLSEYKNSISEIKDPYIKIRRSTDGFLAIEVQTHQCIRELTEENIISNGTINYPTIDVYYENNLAGFDILYKSPDSNEFVQLDTLLIYSQPIEKPFCYYQVIKEGLIRISFNSKDNYFKPDFNSELKIITYLTNGKSGNFDVYNGTNIKLEPNNNKWYYTNQFLVAAKPIGSSSDGTDSVGIESLQALTVEGYRTALAITTESDLAQFFNNYKYRYGNSDILFIKKRDDVYERVFSAFMIIKKDDFIYKTNTLNLNLNISEMKLIEKDVYVLEPGYLFTCNNDDGYAEFLRDEEKYNQYYADYLDAVEQGTIPFIEEHSSTIPPYLDRAASYAEYKRRHNLEDKLTVFDLKESDYPIYDNPQNTKFLLMNPFLIYFTKSPNLVNIYMTYVTNYSLLDFTNQNDKSFVQFVIYTLDINREFSKEKKFNINAVVSTSVLMSDKYPVIHTNTDKTEYIFGGRYDVVNNDLRVIMTIQNDSKNICFIELYPTSFDNLTNSFTFEGEIFTDDHITSDGRLRILDGKVYRNDSNGDYYKVHENDYTLYDKFDKDNNLLEADVPVDTVTDLYNRGILKIWYNVHNMTSESDILIPMENATCKIYTLYNRIYSESAGELIPVTSETRNNIFYQYDERYDKMIWTNEYTTVDTLINFMIHLDSIRTSLTFKDFTICHTDPETGKIIYENDILDAEMKSINYLRASTYLDKDLLIYFFNTFLSNYRFITDAIDTRLRNCTNIDTKFYNTYGRSKNLIIGENNEQLDTVNISLEFDMWFIKGTDLLTAVPAIKKFIKKEIETINSDGMNNLYISNLMRKIEMNFAYVNHIRFISINNYDSTYQTIKNEVESIDELSVLDRRFFVPELLVCDLDDIIIHQYFIQ